MVWSTCREGGGVVSYSFQGLGWFGMLDFMLLWVDDRTVLNKQSLGMFGDMEVEKVMWYFFTSRASGAEDIGYINFKWFSLD